MVVLSIPELDCISLIRAPNPAARFEALPVVDLLSPDAAATLIKACEEFGFFKLIHHGVPIDLMRRLEAEAVEFFSMPPAEKEKSGTASPFGYGNKRIGSNGDMGWVEYLLFSLASEPSSHASVSYSFR